MPPLYQGLSALKSQSVDRTEVCGSSAGQQARRIVDKTAKLIGQVSVVFWQEAAHF